MRKIIITGGAGFIGSHLVERICAEFLGADVLILDKMTYAADIRNVTEVVSTGQADLIVGDVCNYDLCFNLMKDADLVIHAAAESHVDRSFLSSIPFTVPTPSAHTPSWKRAAMRKCRASSMSVRTKYMARCCRVPATRRPSSTQRTRTRLRRPPPR